MVWSQYMDETTTNITEETEMEEDEPIIPRNRPMDYQDWITWYSDDLFNIWMNMKTYREETGTERFLLNDMNWNDFCEICYEYSSKLPK